MTHDHTPQLPPFIPGDPKTEMMCGGCHVPRMFTTQHVTLPPQPSAIRCTRCGQPTWLLCSQCGHPYQPAGVKA